MTPPNTAPASLASRFAWLLREIQTAEAPAVDLLAAVAPWLSPAFPMAYTWHNVSNVLLAGWDKTQAGIVGGFVAAGVEAVGIAAVHTVVGLWGKEKSDNLIRAVIFALGMYLFIVVGANVGLDYLSERPTISILSAALLCLMTITGGIIAGVRARMAREDAERKAKDAQSKAQADSALAEDSRQFDREQESWRERREHEERMLAAANAHAERMAKIERGIDPDAPPIPIAPPPPVQPQLIAEVDPQARAIIADMTAQGKSKTAIVKELLAKTRLGKSQIASALGVDASLVTVAARGIERPV